MSFQAFLFNMLLLDTVISSNFSRYFEMILFSCFSVKQYCLKFILIFGVTDMPDMLKAVSQQTKKSFTPTCTHPAPHPATALSSLPHLPRTFTRSSLDSISVIPTTSFSAHQWPILSSLLSKLLGVGRSYGNYMFSLIKKKNIKKPCYGLIQSSCTILKSY